MAQIPNPQRVALGTVNRDGTVTISREWLRFLGEATGATASEGLASDQVVELRAEVAALSLRVTQLEQEIDGLKAGYQL